MVGLRFLRQFSRWGAEQNVSGLWQFFLSDDDSSGSDEINQNMCFTSRFTFVAAIAVACTAVPDAYGEQKPLIFCASPLPCREPARRAMARRRGWMWRWPNSFARSWAASSRCIGVPARMRPELPGRKAVRCDPGPAARRGDAEANRLERPLCRQPVRPGRAECERKAFIPWPICSASGWASWPAPSRCRRKALTSSGSPPARSSSTVSSAEARRGVCRRRFRRLASGSTHPQLELRLVADYVPREHWNMALATRDRGRPACSWKSTRPSPSWRNPDELAEAFGGWVFPTPAVHRRRPQDGGWRSIPGRRIQERGELRGRHGPRQPAVFQCQEEQAGVRRGIGPRPGPRDGREIAHRVARRPA